MLVLTRKPNESIYLIQNNEIIGEIALSKIVSMNSVNIGLEFGNDIEIVRKELIHGSNNPEAQRMVQNHIARKSEKLPNMRDKTRSRRVDLDMG